MSPVFGVFMASVFNARPIFATSVNLGTVAISVLVAALVVGVAAWLYFNKRTSMSQPAPAKRSLTVTTAGGTHIGGRANNEDSYLIKGNLLLIADGMGGQAAGEEASRTVVGEFNQIDSTRDTWFSDGIVAGNAKMRDMVAADPALKGFGTTVVAARHVDEEIEVDSCGDSHFFRLRAGLLEKLTEEHSLAMALCKQGTISLADVANHRLRNVLYRYVGGTPKDPEWDTLKFQMLPGDIYLLCSDGLVDYSQLTRVQQILESGKSAQEIVDDLLANAVADATKDNATAILVIVS